MPKMVQFGEFLKTWSFRSNSVTRQVSSIWTKIGGKCQNWKIQMRHFEWFLNTVNRAEQIYCSRNDFCGFTSNCKGSLASVTEEESRESQQLWLLHGFATDCNREASEKKICVEMAQGIDWWLLSPQSNTWWKKASYRGNICQRIRRWRFLLFS